MAGLASLALFPLLLAYFPFDVAILAGGVGITWNTSISLMMIGNESLEAENGAARERLMRCISELERVEADLTSLLRAEERYNDSNRAIAAALRSDRSSHAATVARLEGSLSHLEEEVISVTKALDDAKREMEGMQSPRSRDA
jgi:chromosome segregation ATPase